ncbi:hypothetical protein [Rhizobium sp. S163]|uniref:hypothetical protein n=1 Tax=Rhizobium sp. S163 TaxID=3055039 RepID=UPI0025A96408|nr:hypothetical protein [Rhizobium sp. S163]MDM9644516.1 hypothetical protein [Rhizobium sp. S163]
MVDAARFTLIGICGFEVTAQTVRKALESALAAAPAPAEHVMGIEPVLYVSEKQLDQCIGTYLPTRATAEGNFQLPLYRRPAAADPVMAAARSFMDLFVVDDQGLSVDHIDMMELTHRFVALGAALKIEGYGND